MLALVGGIIGGVPHDEKTRLCVHSVMGQMIVYALARPFLVRLWPELKMTPAQLDRIADHIADFSLAFLRQGGKQTQDAAQSQEYPNDAAGDPGKKRGRPRDKRAATAASESSYSPPGAPRSRRRIVLLAAVAVIAVAPTSFGGHFSQRRSCRRACSLSGRIEGDDAAIGPKTSGRIVEIRFREGDNVKAGEIIAVLSDEQIRAREEQARAAVSVAEARGKAARDQIAVLDQQLQQNQLQTAQSKVDADGRVRQAEGELAAAESTLAQQEAAYQSHHLTKMLIPSWRRRSGFRAPAKQAASTAGQPSGAVAAAETPGRIRPGALTTAKRI